MSSHFPDHKPFPEQEANPRAVMGGNNPPLEESIVADYDAAIVESGLRARVDALVAKGADPKPCPDNETAGRYGDYLKLVGAADKAIEEEREKLNRPLLTAQRTLKGRADAIRASLKESADKVRSALEVFMAAERKRVADEAALEMKRRADAAAVQAAEDKRLREAATKLAEEAARAAAPADELFLAPPPAPVPDPEPVYVPEPVKFEAPVARGDYGARVGSKTVWKWEIQSVRQLPNDVLNHEKVVAAINQVIGARVRSGTRTLKGTRIWDMQETSVR